MSKLILAINAGSSSLKFQLIRMPEEELVTKGLVERIGLKDSILQLKSTGKKLKQYKISRITLRQLISCWMLLKRIILLMILTISMEQVTVLYMVVKIPESVAITDEVEKEIEELSELAPLHNPANLMGIRAFRKLLPNIPHVAIFDTAFHQTMPEKAYLYSLPYHYYKDYGIRKYGFHGTSHKFVSQRAAEMLDKPIEDLRIISCHIGNGASIAAIDGGKSIDTSMGFTPLAGVTMGTRSGNIDPALIPFIMEKLAKLLNKY